MADLTFASKNNQKKTLSIFASDLCSTAGHTFASLPQESLVTKAYVVVTKADTTNDSTIDVKIGNTVIANEVSVEATGTIVGSVTPTYFATGGVISFVPGAVAGAGNGEVKLVIEFIETELTNGQYL